MKTPETDEIEEKYEAQRESVGGILEHARELERSNTLLRKALLRAKDLLDDVGEGTVDEKLERWHDAKKARIIERTAPSGRKTYVIQQRHFLFRWWWVDAEVNSLDGALCCDSYGSLEEARQNLCWFDGTKHTEKVVG